MMDVVRLLEHSAVYGGVLSALMTLMFIGIAIINPEIWLNDYPPDIQQKFGPMSAKAQKQRILAAIPVFLALIGIVALSLIRFAQINGGQLTFTEAFLIVFFILLIFNLVDLLVLDWLFFVTIQPRFIILPGTEGMPGYRDYGFHLRAFLKGLIGSTIVSLIVAGLILLFDTIVA